MSKIKITVLIICSLFLLIGCAVNSDGAVAINRENSAFQDFTIEGSTVHIICQLEVQNTCSRDVSISVAASSPEDVAGGLLANPELVGRNLQTGDAYFSIPAGSVQKIDVDFCGTYGIHPQKADRSLPDEMEVTIAEAAQPLL